MPVPIAVSIALLDFSSISFHKLAAAIAFRTLCTMLMWLMLPFVALLLFHHCWLIDTFLYILSAQQLLHGSVTNLPMPPPLLHNSSGKCMHCNVFLIA